MKPGQDGHLADPELPHSAQSRQQSEAEKTKRKNTRLDGTWILRIALQLSLCNVMWGVWMICSINIS